MTAIEDIEAERKRQGEIGLTANDDRWQNTPGDMARAAASYAVMAGLRCVTQDGPLVDTSRHICPSGWPWSKVWWKPTTIRRDLVKAGALIVAEIDRLDRAAERQKKPDLAVLRMTAYPENGGSVDVPYERWELTVEATGEVIIHGEMPVDQEAVRRACDEYHRRIRPGMSDQLTVGT